MKNWCRLGGGRLYKVAEGKGVNFDQKLVDVNGQSFEAQFM